MSPDYHIITPRLVLKLIPQEDATKLADCVTSSPSLHRWIDWCHAQFSTKEAERFILATRLNWVKSEAYGFGVYRRCDNALIGMVAINELYHTFNMASLGYWLSDAYQKQGYAKEAFDSLVEFCFSQLKVTRIEVVCDPENKPSQKLAESCGAQYEVSAPNRYLFNGQPRQGFVYSILPDNR
ncbi:GNAT family N-acetyltransferase [Vibrio sp. Isolate23]|uniref:GNAT family N-acetyltransferase n=1 Tax=Vibrio TaxID=662 RepID=UPI001EFCE118|nr:MULTISPECIES: GNAT family protein [Vibrio]MCG9678570.1 GNAT family N-acetyltransferase [Vibrio sp. Isolate24]MCG9683203.1 GNAT family N-acetyltransferase [Vibrio sp. Isolate23]USD31489.1 GNAT family N-acetyltransferase [Vibrio sp. SCSIO 43186]USD44533.1 GNAT family N-acetyltransferase [Vibrio sp. SCSIO 43145]USD68612.1 GNAT family N-acetyltransferase [Vibrio sp. SCSIO 43139]